MILEFSINMYIQYEILYKIGLTAYLSIEYSTHVVLLNYHCSFTWFTPKPLCLYLNHFNPLLPSIKNQSSEPPTRQLIPLCSCAIGVVFPIPGYNDKQL